MVKLIAICFSVTILVSHCTSITKLEKSNFVFPDQMVGLVSVIPFSPTTVNFDQYSINPTPYQILWPVSDENILVKQSKISNKLTLINTSNGRSRPSMFYNSVSPILDFCSTSDSIYILHDKAIICKLLNGDTFTYINLPPGVRGNKIRYEEQGLVLYGRKETSSLKSVKLIYRPSNRIVHFKDTYFSSGVDINSNTAVLNWNDRGNTVNTSFGFDENTINLISFKTQPLSQHQLYSNFLVEKSIDSSISEIKNYLFKRNIVFFDSLRLADTATVSMIDISSFPEKSKLYELSERIIYAHNTIYIVTGDDKYLYIRKLANSFPPHSTRITSPKFENFVLHNERLDGEVDFRFRLMSILSRYNKKYKLYDIKTFLSYIPDSLNTASLENERRRLLIRKNLLRLVAAYRSYDQKINREDDKGVLYTALRFVQRTWYFDSTYIRPNACLLGSSEVKWRLPKDLLYRRHKSRVRGIPYCWAGKKVIEDINGGGFLKDIRNRLAPGNVFTGVKDLCVIGRTTGIDCSGLVVNSFKLNEDLKGKDEIQGTSNLASTDRFEKIGNKIGQLKRGDILLKADKHVAICYDITDREILFVHSSTQPWGDLIDGLHQGCKVDKISRQKLSRLLDQGYFIYRLNMVNYSYEPYLALIEKYLY